MTNIRIGLGSWTDREYAGLVYPARTPADRLLAAYAQRFNHIEINSSYHALPRREVVAKWVKATPANFTFSFKLPRAFSQSPSKAAEGPMLEYLLKSIQPLVRARKLGALLLVLPPSFAPPRHRLEELDTVATKLKSFRLAVELRHRAWVTGKARTRTLAYFRAHHLAWVAVDMPRVKGSDIMPVVDEVTREDLGYVRLHGRNRNWLQAESAAERHQYSYTPRELRELAKRIRQLGKKTQTLHVIANNHAEDFAPRTALALQELLRAE